MMGSLMVCTLFVDSVQTATIFTALAGIPWGVALWVPFSLIGEFLTGQKHHYSPVAPESTPGENIDAASSSYRLVPRDEEGYPNSSSSNSSHSPILENGMVLGIVQVA